MKGMKTLHLWYTFLNMFPNIH